MAIEENQGSLIGTYRTLSKWTIIWSYPVVIFLAIFSEYIMNFLFGIEYRGNSDFVLIMLCYLLFSLIVGPTSLATQMKGKQNVEIFLILISILFLLTFSKSISIIFGVIGIVVFFYSATIISDILLAIYLYKKYNLSPFSQKNFKTIISLMILLFLLFYLLTSIDFSFINSIFLLVLFETIAFFILYRWLNSPSPSSS